LTYYRKSDLLLFGLSIGIFTLASFHIASCVAIAVFLIVLTSYFRSLFFSMSIRALLLFLFSFQFLLGPALAYNIEGYQPGKYYMGVDEVDYFSYAIPGVLTLAFSLGLPLSSRGVEIIDRKKMRKILRARPDIGPMLLVLGVLFGFGTSFVPGVFAFVLYILSYLKFIGVFHIFMSEQKGRFAYVALAYSFVAVTSIVEGMFHDLVILLIMLLPLLVQSIRISKASVILLLVTGVYLTTTLQIVKSEYRENISDKAGAERMVLFVNTFIDGLEGVLEFDELEDQISRINQGWILSRVLLRVPDYIPYSEGVILWQSVKSSLYPRFLYPDKLVSGSNPFFTPVTGVKLGANTSMGLGIFEVSFVDFGYWGLVVVFAYGLLLNFMLVRISLISEIRPTLMLWLPVIFLYSVRPDADFFTSLNHLIKSSIVVWSIYYFARKRFFPKVSASASRELLNTSQAFRRQRAGLIQ